MGAREDAPSPVSDEATADQANTYDTAKEDLSGSAAATDDVVQLEPIIPFLVELIIKFILLIKINNERIRPPNIYTLID